MGLYRRYSGQAVTLKIFKKYLTRTIRTRTFGTSYQRYHEPHELLFRISLAVRYDARDLYLNFIFFFVNIPSKQNSRSYEK
jgi:hypothetical protein